MVFSLQLFPKNSKLRGDYKTYNTIREENIGCISAWCDLDMWDGILEPACMYYLYGSIY